MLDQAKALMKRRGLENIDFSVQDLLRLDFADGAFDAVIASNVLHLLPEPEKAILEPLRVLRPGGALILPTFLLGSSSRAGRGSIKLLELAGFRASHKWTAEEYWRFLESCGLELTLYLIIDAPNPIGFAVAKKPA